MITTLDSQPQEWMNGDASIFHTVAACHFENEEHIEYWIQKLIPKNKNGRFIKWSEGKRNLQTRDEFMKNCIQYSNDIDFQVNCVSTSEGEMSWFAWAFYMQNKSLIEQKVDSKNRNCMVFKINDESNISFPVLRAGNLIWYYQIIRYLEEEKHIRGPLISDYFACDEMGPGEAKAQGVAFINYLLLQSRSSLQISLPTNERYKNLDRLSTIFVDG